MTVRSWCISTAALAAGAAGTLAAAVPTPDIYFDFEPGNVSGTTVTNLGSAGAAFNGTITTLDRTTASRGNRTLPGEPPWAGPSAFTPLISSDAKEGAGAYQPTNLVDSSPGASDAGGLGGPVNVPAFDLGLQYSFSAWVKYGTNPNQTASNLANPTNNRNRRIQTIFTASDEAGFPFNGSKLFLNGVFRRDTEFDPDSGLFLPVPDDRGLALEKQIIREVEGNVFRKTITPEDSVPLASGGGDFDESNDVPEYHHVAITFDASGAAGTPVINRFFVDGVELTSELSDPTASPFLTEFVTADYRTKPINIGASNNVNEPYFGFGVIDEVKFFANTVLSEADIAELAGIASLDGDYNDDGSVDQGDLDLVLLNWGDDASATGVPAGWVNMQPTGLIGQTELDGVLLNWGNTAEANGNAVPEPATAALLALGGIATLRRR